LHTKKIDGAKKKKNQKNCFENSLKNFQNLKIFFEFFEKYFFSCTYCLCLFVCLFVGVSNSPNDFLFLKTDDAHHHRHPLDLHRVQMVVAEFHRVPSYRMEVEVKMEARPKSPRTDLVPSRVLAAASP
jgi:hypothetical protein